MSKGFTLLELMVAITILAGISLALYAASTQIITSQDRVESQDEFQHGVSSTMNRITRDLSMAYIVKSPEMLGDKFEGEIAFSGAEDRLDFASFSHQRFVKNAPESDSVEIGYYLVSDPEDRDKKILMRRESPVVDKNIEEGGRSYPMLEGVRAMHVEYLPVASEEWRKVWDTKSVESSNQLPRAIKISLEFQASPEEDVKTYSQIVKINMTQPLAF